MRGSAGSVTLAVGAAAAAAAAVVTRTGVAGEYRTVLEVLPELLAVLAGAVGARFGRSRAVGMAVLLAGLSVASRTSLPPGVEGALAVAVPLALGVLAALPEAPLATLPGLVAAGGPTVAAAAAGIAAWTGDGPARAVLAAGPTAWAAFLLSVAVAAMAYLVRRGALDAAVLWAVALAARAPVAGGTAAAAALTAGGLTVLTALAEEAYRLAYHDGLTGLPSRRALDEALDRLEPPFAVAMVDVDRFKRFNDRFGHEAGDQALRMVARELERGVGRSGRTYRYGGEEFAVLLPGITVGEAREVMDAVRRTIAERPFALRAPERSRRRPKRPARRGARRTTRVTVSVGVAGSSRYRPRPEDVLAAADRALYRAKAAGRDRVVAARG